MLAPTTALLRGFAFPAQAAHAAPAAQAGGQRQGFRVGNLRLMIRYEDGSELTEMPAVFALPNAPRWFAGITNLHGALVPVFDPAAFLGVTHARDRQRMLLVLGHGDNRTGMVIDGLPSRLKLVPGDRLDQASVPQALRTCVSDVYRIDGDDWMDFQHAPLLDLLEAQLQS